MLTTYHLEGMCCASEEGVVRRRLEGIAGVSRLSFQTLERRVTVEHTADEALVRHALDSLGLGARRLEPNTEDPRRAPAERPGPSWLQLGLALTLALASETCALLGWSESSWLVVGLALTAIALGGRETLRKGTRSLRALAFNMNFLMTVAVLGAISLGEWAEAAMVTVLFGVAEALEGRAVDRARQAIQKLLELAPEEALLVTPTGERAVPVAEVKVGQQVRVRPGERIPLDGKVTAGSSSVNQAPITGESLPVEKQLGDAVYAGTINERGSFDLEVTANRGHTTLDRIIATVQQAQSERAPTQRFVDRFAAWYTPLMLLLAVATVAIPTLLWRAELGIWVYRALVLLVIACPCALVISTPVSVVSGLAAAARRGILVKGGAYLEQGRRLKYLALDKTGTLTRGQPEVTDLKALTEDVGPAEILRVAAALEARSEHPIAAAVLGRYQVDESGAPPPPVREFESLTGRGVRAELDGVLYFLGNHRLVEEQGVCSPALERQLEELEAQGKTAVVLLTAERAVGILAVADRVRESSQQAIAELRSLGLEIVMLTGDNKRTAEAIAQQVGIERVHAELLPGDKLTFIEQAGRAGARVGMVGDGINDAPALAKADIGFAMGAMGTDTAIETADVALMQDDLRKLPEFLRLSQRLFWVLTQNISFSLAVKALFFWLALAGHATLWMAVFADLGASLLVVGNGLRLLKVRD